MKNYFLLFLSILLFSCKKENAEQQSTSIASKFYNKAKICRDSNVPDSAFVYYNLAKSAYLEERDSLGVGKSLVNMSILQYNKQDYYGSIESSLEANNFLKKTSDSTTKSTLASSFNNMGICSSYLYEFENSILFYNQALKYVTSPKNKYFYHNNLADVLITLGDYKNAQRNLTIALQTKDSLMYAQFINNMARAKYYENPNYDPLPEFYKALKIRKDSNDFQGQNSSYATLSIYFFNKDKKKALEYAKKMLEIAIKNDSKEDQLQALQKIINLDKANYLENFTQFQALNDSIQISRSKAKNQFAVVRYDVEKIQREKAEKEIQVLERNIGIGSLIVLLILGFIWYIKRQKQLKQEKELEVKNTQLKMSKKVHDVVANGIYQVMAKIENQEDFDREKTLDELEFVYEKSRNLSYEKAVEEKEFSQEISELIASFNNASVKTFTAGNSSSVWTNISAPVKEEIYQVLRELMVNMKKHSKASHVAVKFEKADQNIEIQYKDNGVGISGDLIYKNGLRNTASRIEGIGGNITFETKIEKGLKVNISFPSS